MNQAEYHKLVERHAELEFFVSRLEQDDVIETQEDIARPMSYGEADDSRYKP